VHGNQALWSAFSCCLHKGVVMAPSKSSARSSNAGGDEDQRFQAAAFQHYVWHSMLCKDPLNQKYSVGAAMREAGFTEEQSKNATLQQRVRRLKAKLENQNSVNQRSCTDAPPVSFVNTAITSPVSTITEPSPTASSVAVTNASHLGGM